jgi:hypothetical protein
MQMFRSEMETALNVSPVENSIFSGSRQIRSEDCSRLCEERCLRIAHVNIPGNKEAASECMEFFLHDTAQILRKCFRNLF